MHLNEFRERDPYSPIKFVYGDVQEIFNCQSQYQEVKVLYHHYFGTILVLDGVVQLTERDEFFYHELLVHVPLSVHPNPEHVLILGGGDGGSLREVLKHPEIVSVTLVEIDPAVVEVSNRFLPGLTTGFTDPRTRIIYDDGTSYLQDKINVYDVIIVDGPDPVGPARNLLSSLSLERASRALRGPGIFSAQTESLHFHKDSVVAVQKKLMELFPIVDLYTQSIATYAGNWWTFSIGSMQVRLRLPTRRIQIPTRYYSAEVHRKAFFPRDLYRKLINGLLPW